MSKLATTTVEIAFTGGDASPSWTDVSAYVLGVTTSRGRSREVDQFNAGTLTLTLKNNDRRFDPLYTAGPYYGSLTANLPIRVKATWNAVTYTVWRGYTDAWPVTYDIPNIATTTLTATDGFKRLERAILDSPYYAAVTADAPTHWWLLNESAGANAYDSGSSPVTGTYFASPTLGVSSIISGDNRTAVTFDGSTQFATMPHAAMPTGSTFSIECWFKTTTTVPSGQESLFRMSDTAGTYRVELFMDGTASGHPGVLAAIAGGSGVVTPDSPRYDDQAAHHVVLTNAGTGGTDFKLYVDGSLVGSDTGRGTPSSTTTLSVASEKSAGTSAIGFFAGTLQSLAIYDGTVLNATQVAAHHAAGLGNAGELSSARAARLLDAAGWDSSLRNLDTGKVTLQATPTNTAGNSALSALHTVDDTESGALYMSADGKVTFRNRWGPIADSRSITSQATFGDSGTELPYADAQLDYDDTLLRNYVTGQRDGGTQQIARDSTSISTYGTVGFSRPTTLEQDDVSVLYACQKLVADGKAIRQRVQSLVVNGEADFPNKSGSAANSLYPQILGREIGDRITVKRRPQGVGSAINLDFLIEGIGHVASPSQWVTTFQLSPIPGATDDGTVTGYLVLDNATLGKLNSNRLGF